MPAASSWVASTVLPAPALPTSSVQRPRGNPPSATRSRPEIPVASRGFVCCVLVGLLDRAGAEGRAEATSAGGGGSDECPRPGLASILRACERMFVHVGPGEHPRSEEHTSE